MSSNPLESYGSIHSAFERRKPPRPTIKEASLPPSVVTPGTPGVTRTIVQRALQPYGQASRVYTSPEHFREELVIQVDTLGELREIVVDPTGGTLIIRRNLKAVTQVPSRLRLGVTTGRIEVFSFIALPHEIEVSGRRKLSVRFEALEGANVQIYDGLVVGLYGAQIVAQLGA